MSYEYERTVWSNEETSLSADHFNNMEEGIVHALTPATSSENGAMTAEDKAKLDSIVDIIYPVGSVYISVNSADPANLFGGLWRKIEGRFLLGSSSSYELGAQGGNANAIVPYHNHSVSLTTNSTGAHTHTYSFTNNSEFQESGSGTRHKQVESYSAANTSSAGAHAHSVSGNTGYVGSSVTGANMPPYLVVNVWERYA